MVQRKSSARLGQGWPAGLVMAKSADAAKAGATQHRAKQRAQSARRSRRSGVGTASHGIRQGSFDAHRVDDVSPSTEGARMLAVTDAAADAISALTAQEGVQNQGGLRFELRALEDSQTALALSVAPAP